MKFPSVKFSSEVFLATYPQIITTLSKFLSLNTIHLRPLTCAPGISCWTQHMKSHRSKIVYIIRFIVLHALVILKKGQEFKSRSTEETKHIILKMECKKLKRLSSCSKSTLMDIRCQAIIQLFHHIYEFVHYLKVHGKLKTSYPTYYHDDKIKCLHQVVFKV